LQKFFTQALKMFKIVLLQTALSLDIKEVFDYHFKNELGNHGCHCARIAGNLNSTANSAANSVVDAYCNEWQKARNCGRLSDECIQHPHTYFQEFDCENQPNPCATMLCRLDEKFVSRINDSKVHVNESVKATCSFETATPKNFKDLACCLNEDFKSNFYFFSKQFCMNGELEVLDLPTMDELYSRVGTELQKQRPSYSGWFLDRSDEESIDLSDVHSIHDDLIDTEFDFYTAASQRSMILSDIQEMASLENKIEAEANEGKGILVRVFKFFESLLAKISESKIPTDGKISPEDAAEFEDENTIMTFSSSETSKASNSQIEEFFMDSSENEYSMMIRKTLAKLDKYKVETVIILSFVIVLFCYVTCKYKSSNFEKYEVMI